MPQDCHRQHHTIGRQHGTMGRQHGTIGRQHCMIAEDKSHHAPQLGSIKYNYIISNTWSLLRYCLVQPVNAVASHQIHLL